MARFNSRTGIILHRGLHQRHCRVELLESRALLTGGLNFGDYAVDASPRPTEPSVAEVASVNPVAEPAAWNSAPSRTGNASQSGIAAPTWTAARDAGNTPVVITPLPEPEQASCSRQSSDTAELSDEKHADEKHADEVWASPDDDGCGMGAGSTAEEVTDSHFSPNSDLLVSVPADDSTPPVDDQAEPGLLWQMTHASTSQGLNRFDTASAVEQQSVASPTFHYFEAAQPPAGTLSPSLAAERLAVHAAYDTFMGLALIPPAPSGAMAVRQPLPVSTSNREAPSNHMVAAETRLPAASQATLARAQEMVQSIDAALAELAPGAVPPAPSTPETRHKSVGELSATDSAQDRGGEQAVAESRTLRLGFFALGSLVLTSRWAPLARTTPPLAGQPHTRSWLAVWRRLRDKRLF